MPHEGDALLAPKEVYRRCWAIRAYWYMAMALAAIFLGTFLLGHTLASASDEVNQSVLAEFCSNKIPWAAMFASGESTQVQVPVLHSAKEEVNASRRVLKPLYYALTVTSALSLIGSAVVAAAGVWMLAKHAMAGSSKTLLHLVTMNALCDTLFSLDLLIVASSFVAGDYSWVDDSSMQRRTRVDALASNIMWPNDTNCNNFYYGNSTNHPQAVGELFSVGDDLTPQCSLSAWMGTFSGVSSISWNGVVVLYLLIVVCDAQNGGDFSRTRKGSFLIGSHLCVWGYALIVCLLGTFAGHQDGGIYAGFSYSTSNVLGVTCNLTGSFNWLFNGPLIIYLVLALLVLAYLYYVLRCAPRGFERTGGVAAEDGLLQQMVVFTIFYTAMWTCPAMHALKWWSAMRGLSFETAWFDGNPGSMPDWFQKACVLQISLNGLVNAGVWASVYGKSWLQLRDAKANQASVADEDIGSEGSMEASRSAGAGRGSMHEYQ